MYITRIVLRNIRGFAELDFDLTRPDGSYAGWTVFTGDNGSGKSTCSGPSRSASRAQKQRERYSLVSVVGSKTAPEGQGFDNTDNNWRFRR